MSHGVHLDKRSPAAEVIGREVLEIDAETGVVRLAFVAKPEFANRHGTVAGGFLAAMLDSTTAAPILAFLAEELSVVTPELRVAYLRPAATGPLFGVGRVTKRTEREVLAEGELSDAEGHAIARATANFRVVSNR